MKNKRVLFLINKLEVGGAQKVFANDLSELKKRGNNVTMCYLFGGSKEEEAFKDKLEGVERIFLGINGIYDLKGLIRFRSLIIEKKIGVIYSTLNESNIFARFVKLVTPSVSVVIREANVAGPKPFKFKVLDVVLNFLVEKIICVSEDVRTSLWYQNIYKNKMMVLMNGVVIPGEAKDYSNLSEPIRLLNVGGLTTKKGQKFLIEAVANYAKQSDVRVTLDIYGGDYGKGNYKGYLNDQILENGATEIIHIHDFVSQEELSKVYINNDLFILSSLHEGCPNVLLEAMAHGLVPISTKVSGSNEIIDGTNGLLVDLGSAKALEEGIRNIINKKEKFKEMGKMSREKMEKEFSVDAHINKLESILNIQ